MPTWLGRPPDALNPGQIAALYRAPRKGCEGTKDEPGAADFYYGEMEMRRARSPRAAARNSARGRAERGIPAVYWLVSGYGLRAWRAFAWLAALTALLAVAFHAVGFAKPPPDFLLDQPALRVPIPLSLTDSNVQLTAWGQLLQGLLRPTGPVLLDRPC